MGGNELETCTASIVHKLHNVIIPVVGLRSTGIPAVTKWAIHLARTCFETFANDLSNMAARVNAAAFANPDLVLNPAHHTRFGYDLIRKVGLSGPEDLPCTFLAPESGRTNVPGQRYH